MIAKLIIAFFIIIILALIANCYKKVGPNEVLVVTGGWLKGPYVQESSKTHTKVKIIKGGGAFIWPVIQQAQIQSLDIFHIDVKLEDVQTVEAVPIDVKANATLRVGSDPEMIAIASEKMLGLTPEDRNLQMTDIVKGAVRDVITQLTPREANNREKFQDAVIKVCQPTFSDLGLEVTNLNVTDVDDKQGYYQSLATPEIARNKSHADQEQAKAVREAVEAEAENKRQSQIAQLESEQAIAAKQKEVDIAKAQYDAETRKAQAIADKAQDIANAEQDSILEEKQIAVNENKLKATVITQQKADNEANKQKADADFYIAKQKADADAYAVTANGHAEQDKIASIGKAKADSQKALAEALASQGSEESLASKVIDILPEIAKENAKQMANIDKLTVLNGAQGLNDLNNASLVSAIETIKNTTGIDISDLIAKRSEGLTTIKGQVPTKEE